MATPAELEKQKAALDLIQANSNALATKPQEPLKPKQGPDLNGVNQALATEAPMTASGIVDETTELPGSISNFFDDHTQAQASALHAGVNGNEAPPPTSIDPAGQRPGEPEWNFNMRKFGSGFKPEAYDPKALANINDDPAIQALRLTEDRKLGLNKPIAYNPASLMNINDNPVTRLVNMFAASGQAQAERGSTFSLAGTRRERRDMRMDNMRGSEAALAAVKPTPAQEVSNLVQDKAKQFAAAKKAKK